MTADRPQINGHAVIFELAGRWVLSTAASSSDDSRCSVGYRRQLRFCRQEQASADQKRQRVAVALLTPWLHYAAREDGSGGLLALPQRACFSCSCRESGARSCRCCAQLDKVMETAEAYLEVGERASSEQRSVCQSSSLSNADPKPPGSVVPMSMTLGVGSLQQLVESRAVAIALCYSAACFG